MPGFASRTRRQCHRSVLVDLVLQRGPRTDERHVATHDVPELGELVEARLAKKPAEDRHAGVVGDLEHTVTSGLLRLTARLDEPAHVLLVDGVVVVDVHRPELQHREGLRHLADPDLLEKHGAGRPELHESGDDQHQRRQECQECSTCREIECTLDQGIQLDVAARLKGRQQRVDRLKGCVSNRHRSGRMCVQPNGESAGRLRVEPCRQLFPDLRLELRGYGVGIGNFWQDEAQDRALLQPAENVRVPLRGCERRGSKAPRAICRGAGRLVRRQEEQQECLVRSIGPPAFTNQHALEQLFVDDVGGHALPHAASCRAAGARPLCRVGLTLARDPGSRGNRQRRNTGTGDRERFRLHGQL